MILFLDSEGPDQTVRMHILIWAFGCPHMPEDMFSHGAIHLLYSPKMLGPISYLPYLF